MTTKQLSQQAQLNEGPVRNRTLCQRTKVKLLKYENVFLPLKGKVILVPTDFGLCNQEQFYQLCQDGPTTSNFRVLTVLEDCSIVDITDEARPYYGMSVY